jgi:hypothetical protein
MQCGKTGATPPSEKKPPYDSPSSLDKLPSFVVNRNYAYELSLVVVRDYA